MRFERVRPLEQATPPDTVQLHRLRRAITVLRWVVAIAVFVPLADFLGGVDLVDFVGSRNRWMPSTVLGLFFSALISGGIALTFGTAVEWTCRHRLERAHHEAASARIAETAARTVRRS